MGSRRRSRSLRGSRSWREAGCRSGCRDLLAYCIGYTAHATGYLLLVTDRYPTTDPSRVVPLVELPPHSVRLELTDEVRRSRLTVFFRFPLAVPHLIWLTLWSALVVVLVRARLVDHARDRTTTGAPAPVLHRVDPVHDPRDCVPLRDRRAVPRVHGARRELPGGHRVRPCRSRSVASSPRSG